MKPNLEEKRTLLKRINNMELAIWNNEPCKDEYETFERYLCAMDRAEKRNHKVSEILNNLKQQVLDNETSVSKLYPSVTKIFHDINYEYWDEY